MRLSVAYMMMVQWVVVVVVQINVRLREERGPPTIKNAREIGPSRRSSPNRRRVNLEIANRIIK